MKLPFTSQTCRNEESEHYLKKIGFIELGGIQLNTVLLPFRLVLEWVTALCGFPEHYELVNNKENKNAGKKTMTIKQYLFHRRTNPIIHTFDCSGFT